MTASVRSVAVECGVLFWLTYEVGTLFKHVEDANALVELTAEQTAEALTQEQAENAVLKSPLESARRQAGVVT